MDTEVTGEIGELNTKFGFVFSNFIFIMGQGFPSASAFTNFIAKSKGPNLYANEIINNQISACDIVFNEEKKCDLISGTALAKVINQKIVNCCSVQDYMKQFCDIANDFVCQLPQTIELKFEMGDHYDTDYNNLNVLDAINERSGKF